MCFAEGEKEKKTDNRQSGEGDKTSAESPKAKLKVTPTSPQSVTATALSSADEPDTPGSQTNESPNAGCLPKRNLLK